MHSKRFGEISKLLPLTYKVLDKKLYALFQQYAETYLPVGIKKHCDDAIHFAAFIEQITHEKHLEPAWISEILLYEKAALQATEITRRITVYRSQYAIEKLVQSVERGEADPIIVKRPTIVVWLRLSQTAPLTYYRLALPV